MDNCLGYVLNEEKNSLNHALNYAENPDKAHQLVTGINCQAATAYSEMQATKRRWDKTGGILGYHIIHSYAPGEVTPEEAHAAGAVSYTHLRLQEVGNPDLQRSKNPTLTILIEVILILVILIHPSPPATPHTVRWMG